MIDQKNEGATLAPLVLGRRDVEAMLPPLPDIVAMAADIYREGAAGQVDVPTKIGVHTDRPLSFLHAMPAWLAARREIGLKWVSYFPGSGAAPDSDATAIMILNEPEHGRPVAIMEAMHFTNARTAACGLFAAEHLAPDGPAKIGLIGCGGLPTWTVPELLRRYPSVERVTVTSRRAETREAFARRLERDTGVTFEAVKSVEATVRDADIVISAIPQGPPPIAQGSWLKDSALVIAYDILGTWDDAALDRFGLLATDGLPRLENIVRTVRTTARLPAKIVTFEELASADAPSARPDGAPVLAVPTGVGSLDVAVAWEIYRRAEAAGLGQRITLL